MAKSYKKKISSYSKYARAGYAIPDSEKKLDADIKNAKKYFGKKEIKNPDALKKKYRKYVLKHHPDRGGDPEKFQKVVQAYDLLQYHQKQQEDKRIKAAQEKEQKTAQEATISKTAEYIQKRKKSISKAGKYFNDTAVGIIQKKTWTERVKALPVIRTVNKEPKTMGGYANKGFEKITGNDKYKAEIQKINADRMARGEKPLGFATRMAVYKEVQQKRASEFAQKQGVSKKQWIARGRKAEAIGTKAYKTTGRGVKLAKEGEYGALAKGGVKVGAKVGYKGVVFGANKSVAVGIKGAKLTKYAGVKAAGMSLATTRTTAKYAGKAMSNLSNAAKRVVESNRLLAILKPVFWYIKFAQIGLSKPMPFIYAGLIIGIGLMIWLYGILSGYYALYFLKCIPAVVVNFFLSIANAIWFAMVGVYNTVVAGLITIINQVAYFFIGGLLDAFKNGVAGIHIGNGFTGIPYAVNVQPGNAFAYFVPDPLNVSSPLATLGSMAAFTMIAPGANPFEYDYSVSDAPTLIFENLYTENGATLYFPKVNTWAQADGFWCKLESRPPDIHYDWTRNPVGYIHGYKEQGWTLLRGADISVSLIGGFSGLLTSDFTPSISHWFNQTGQYAADGSSADNVPRYENMFRTALTEYLIDHQYNSYGMVKGWAKHDPGGYIQTIRFGFLGYGIFGESYCWLEQSQLAEMYVQGYLWRTGYNLTDSFNGDVPWTAIHDAYYDYIGISDNTKWIREEWKLRDDASMEILYLHMCEDSHTDFPTAKHPYVIGI